MSKGLNPRMKNLNDYFHMKYFGVFWWFSCLIVNKLEFNCLTEWAKNISYSSAIEPWANCLDRRLVKYLSGKVL